MIRGLAQAGACAAVVGVAWQAHRLRQPAAAATDDRLARWRPKWEPGGMRGWHIGQVPHPAVAAFEDRLSLRPGARVLVPLAGAAHDIKHFADGGADVVAVEGVRGALDAFAANYAGAAIVESGAKAEAKLKHHAVQLPEGLVHWVEGDFLALLGDPKAAGGAFDAAFDRGGLVAVQPGDRDAYAATLKALMRPGGKILLVTVEHPPFNGGRLGPPHSIDAAEVERLFGGAFDAELLRREDRMEVEPSWKQRGCDYFFESTWLLTRRS